MSAEQTGTSALPADARVVTWVAGTRVTDFDGLHFETWEGADLTALITSLYLAKKARAGDADAAALLAAFRITVVDSDGKRYWPMEGGESP